MICQAMTNKKKGCECEAMPGSDFCGYHDELNEDTPVERKPTPKAVGRPRHTEAQKAAKSVANKAYRLLHYDYTPVTVIKQRARDAASEVLAEVKAKREDRAR